MDYECLECGTQYKKPVGKCRNCGGVDIDLAPVKSESEAT